MYALSSLVRSVGATVGKSSSSATSAVAVLGGRSPLRRWLGSKIEVEEEVPRAQFIYNGEKANSMFSHAEMERRLSLLRAHMADNDISATVLTSMQNVCYFTGFLYCSFGRPYGTVVTADKCLTIAAGIDGGQPWRRSHGDVVIVTDWQKGNFFHIVGTILADVRGSVGFEHDHVTVDTLRAFDVALPTHTKVDVADATMRMRTIKSAEEFDVIRHGARVADIGGVAVVNAMIEGASEVEVAIASTDTMIREIATTFPDSEIRDTWTWFQSGMNTDGAHNPVTTRKLQNGDNCSLNCFPMIQGYYTALERTLFLGHATDEQIRLWEVNCEVHRRGLQLIRPGARCSDIAAELNDIYRRYDLLKYRSFGYGHSFGVMSHYYGREAALELREDVHTTLQPGHVVSMEPMIMVPQGQPGEGAYREHDILIIHADHTENITKFPFGPDSLIIAGNRQESIKLNTSPERRRVNTSDVP